MFTGIVEEKGAVRAVESGALVIATSPSLAARIPRGGSLAVEGVCLTAVSLEHDAFRADVMPETLSRTTLGSLVPGSAVNLELPATPTSFLAGHIVQGHIDVTAAVKRIEQAGNSHVVTIELPSPLVPFLVEKGSIAVDGVSLTVATVEEGAFSVAIIPHTWNETTIGTLREGVHVNLEADILAKYAAQMIMQGTYGRGQKRA